MLKYLKLLCRTDRLFLFLSILISISLSNSYSQAIQNIKVFQSNDTVKIFYDIIGGRPDDLLKITLTVSDDGGNIFSIIPKSMWGDIGIRVETGSNKTIYWLPLKDSIQLIGNNFVFNVSASVVGGENIELVPVKGGIFIMGDTFGEGKTDETYTHDVKLENFEIGAYEITNVQFAKFLAEYGADYIISGEYKNEPMIYASKNGLIKDLFVWEVQPGKEYNPVVGITWYGAYEFCLYYNYRLPTEAEWEYAAREMGKKIKFGDGKNAAVHADINFNGVEIISNNSSLEGSKDSATVRVGNYNPNALGLFDMSGNVWEWCQDWYQSNYYMVSKFDGPTGPWLGKYKVIRGGSWFNSAFGIRTTVRSFYYPYGQRMDIGFRVARSVKD